MDPLTLNVYQACEIEIKQLLERNVNLSFDIKLPVIGQLENPNEFIKKFLNFIMTNNSQYRQLLQMPRSDKILSEISARSPHSVCGASIDDQPSVKCYTCSSDPCSILCMGCFEEAKHVGHNYKVYSGSGLCDCGYAQTINSSGFCSKHKGNQENIDVFVQFQGDFDAERTVATFFVLLRRFFRSFNTSPTEVMFFGQVLLSFVQFPNDLFRSAISHVLMYRGNGPVSDLMFKNWFQYLPPYCDVIQLIENFRNQRISDLVSQIPLGIFVTVIDHVTKIPIVRQFSRYIATTQISEPYLRAFVSYGYYLRNALSCMGSCNQFYYIINNKNMYLELVNLEPFNPKLFFNQKVLYPPQQADFWYEASVQSHNCLNIDIPNLFLSQTLEQCQTMLFYSRAAQGRASVRYQGMQNKYYQQISEIMQSGLVQYIDHLSKTDLPYFTDVQKKQFGQQTLKRMDTDLQIAFGVIKQLPWHQTQTDGLTLKQLSDLYAEISQCYVKVSTLNWSMKNVKVVQDLIQLQLPTLLVVLNLQLNGRVCIQRRKARPCMEDDDSYTNLIFYQSFQMRSYYTKLVQIIFAAAFAKQKEFKFELVSDIERACQQLDNVNDLDMSKILKIALQIEFQQHNLLHNDVNIGADSHRIGEGFGLHCINPTHGEEFEFQYPVTNELAVLISILINIQQLQIGTQQSSEVVKQMLEKLGHVETVCSYFIIVATRLLVTRSLLDAKLLQRCGEHAITILRVVYSENVERQHFFQFHWYQLIQQMLVTKIINPQKFYQMTAESYGFYDLEAEGFEVAENEERESKLKMFGDYLKMICSCTMTDLMLQSPTHLLRLGLLQFLIQMENVNISTIHNSLQNSEFYNYDYVEKQLDIIAQLEEADIKGQLVYSTDQTADRYVISKKGFELIDPLNPFFADTPQFIIEYEKLCKKYSNIDDIAHQLVSRLPIDLQLFSIDLLLLPMICCFIEEQILSSTKSQLVTQNEVLAVLIIAYQFRNEDDVKTLITKIQTKINSQEVQFGPLINAVFKQFIQKEEVAYKNDKISKQQRMKALKDKDKTKTQLMQLEELPETATNEEQIDNQTVEALQLFYDNNYKCSICGIQDCDQPLCFTALIQPTAQIHNGVHGTTTLKKHRYHIFDLDTDSEYDHNGNKMVTEFVRPVDVSLDQAQFLFTPLHPTQLCDFNYNIANCFVIPQIVTCTHTVHQKCMEKMDNQTQLHQCPLCRQLVNVQIPIIQCENSINMLVTVLNVAKALKHTLLLRQIDFSQDNRINYFFLKDLINFGNDNFDSPSLKAAMKLYNVENQNATVFIRNQLIQIIVLLIDASYESFLVTKFQIDNAGIKTPSNNYYQNATKSSAALAFCAHWLFLLCCGKIEQLTHPFFDYDIEQEKIDNAIAALSDQLDSQAKFKRAVLFSATNHIYVGGDFAQIISLQSHMFIKKRNTQLIQQQLDALAISKHKQLLMDVDTVEGIRQAFQLADLYKILKRQQSADDLELDVPTPDLKLNFSKQITDILPRSSLQLVSEQPCACGNHFVICLYCQQKLCPSCVDIPVHCFECGVQRAFFCPAKNLIFFFNTGAVYFAAGPYLSANHESDLLLRKKLNMELNVELVHSLEAFVWFGRYYAIDLDATKVMHVQQFLTKILLGK